MGFSPDKMLQARLISYPDAHRYRWAPTTIPCRWNKPQCPYHTYNKTVRCASMGTVGQR